ncbi:MAG: phosphatidate cytidylyltransferase [Hyphomicrobium zavarzinii]|uniref:phosphatidate cytidylyltransferase n=1 Tax=Hyphomicrobium zavarzinii TaxID=48292 RepID=UPI001A4A8DE3|nr:phosphatidate cytidylyltransferase [Hyphomicrobium zavarzinii]MBL8844298.1 phosphatidate cytidylyltransferase [Hyphomicrobium zavarzinii]
MEEDGTLAEPRIIAPPPKSSDLWSRAASAIALAVVAFGLAWAGVLPFAGLVLVVALVMSWEWCRVVRGEGIDICLIVQGLSIIAAVALASFGFAALGVAVLLIGTIIVLALEFGGHPILSAAGVGYAGLPAVALLWLRGDESNGFHAVLFIVLVVAATDTAAYAFGRLIGGPRLAARISPNKTWSGLIGGITTAGLAAGTFGYVIGSPVLGLAAAGVLMGLIAQAGDLAESALKRAFNVKDASQLLPGHGGFMDRMDGLVTVAVAVALAALFLDPQAPASALLAGLPIGGE